MDRPALALTLLSIALTAASCGSSGDDAADSGRKGIERVVQKVQSLHGKARADKLEAMSTAEGGKLSVYTSLISEQEAALSDAFEKRYDVDLSVYRGTSEAVAQRVTEEIKAGFRGADVIDTGGVDVQTLAEQGSFVPYTPQAASALVEGSLHDGWTASRYNKFAVAWNTKLVPAKDRPRSLEDLADPRWRGELALEESDADWYKTAREYLTREKGTATEADKVLEGIAANSRIVSSHAVQMQLLAAGEFAATPDAYLHQVRGTAADGAPVTATPFVEPLFSRPQGTGILKTSKNPAAAVLYMDWLTSSGAQKVLVAGGASSARRDLSESKGAREVPVDVEEFTRVASEWDDRYERLIRRAPKLPDPG